MEFDMKIGFNIRSLGNDNFALNIFRVVNGKIVEIFSATVNEAALKGIQGQIDKELNPNKTDLRIN